MVEMTKMSSVDQMTLDGSGGLPEGGLDGSSGLDCVCGQDGLGDKTAKMNAMTYMAQIIETSRKIYVI